MIGSSKNCQKYCSASREEDFKAHLGEHIVRDSDEYVREMEDHVNRNVKELQQQKRRGVSEYFSELHNQINLVKMRTFKRLEKAMVPSVLKEEDKNQAKNIELILSGQLMNLKCSTIFEVRQSLDHAQVLNQNPFNSILQGMFEEVSEVTQRVTEQFLEATNLKMKPAIRIVRSNRFGEKDKITKVKDIPKSGLFDIQVKLLKYRCKLQTAKGILVIFKISDESGEIEISYPVHEFMSEGNTVLIKNCTMRIHKGKTSITSSASSEIFLVDAGGTGYRRREAKGDKGFRKERPPREREPTEESQGTEIKRDRKPRDYDRSYLEDRGHQITQRGQVRGGRRNGREKSETSQISEDRNMRRKQNQRDDRAPCYNRNERDERDQRMDRLRRARDRKRDRDENSGAIKRESNYRENERKVVKVQFTKVANIDPGDEDVSIEVKVIEIMRQQGDNTFCIVGDSTGLVNALLPAKEEFIREDTCICMINMQAEVIDEHIVMTMGKNSKIERMRGRIQGNVDFTKNISEPKYIEADDDGNDDGGDDGSDENW